MKRLVCILMCCCMLLPLLPASGEGLSDVMCVYNCKEWVSLREDMSTSSKRLTKVYLGELVTNCKMAYDGFIQCDFGGKTGYIQSKYLKTTKYSSGESFPGNQMVVNVTEWASMWKGPSTSSGRLVKVPVGSIVTSCVGTTGGFILCEYKSGKKVYSGYMSTSYLKKANYSASTKNTSIKPMAGTTVNGIAMAVVNCTDWVSLREKASASSARLARVPLGTTVTECIQVSDAFIYCHYRGLYGYIQAQYLSDPRRKTTLPPAILPTTEPEWYGGDGIERGDMIDTGDEDNTFNHLPVLPEMEAFTATGFPVLMESRLGYTIAVQRVFNNYEEMLGVCYGPDNKPLWRIYAQSLSEVSDVGQLDAFVAGTAQKPQLIWYVSGLGFYSYSFGPEPQLIWFLPNGSGPNISDSIIHTVAADGSFYVAFGTVLMHISSDGKLLWRTSCNDTTIYWPHTIELREDGISVLYDNLMGVEQMYTEVRFNLEGTLLNITQRKIDNEA